MLSWALNTPERIRRRVGALGAGATAFFHGSDDGTRSTGADTLSTDTEVTVEVNPARKPRLEELDVEATTQYLKEAGCDPDKVDQLQAAGSGQNGAEWCRTCLVQLFKKPEC